MSISWCILKVGSLFASDNSEPKIIFEFFSLIFCQFFWCHLKVGSLFGADNSEPKIIFDLFFENVMSISIFELEKCDVNLNFELKKSIVGSVEDVDC